MSLSSTPISKELIEQHGLSEEEYQQILKHLGREPNFTELGIFSVMWSEHCSYKSSRVHLKRFPTEGPRVVQGPGENAGAVDIGDGLAAVFKMESHNHPSFIEPFQGAATGVGGIGLGNPVCIDLDFTKLPAPVTVGDWSYFLARSKMGVYQLLSYNVIEQRVGQHGQQRPWPSAIQAG